MEILGEGLSGPRRRAALDIRWQAALVVTDDLFGGTRIDHP